MHIKYFPAIVMFHTISFNTLTNDTSYLITKEWDLKSTAEETFKKILKCFKIKHYFSD